jgi:oligoendopeptidase F
MLKKEKDPQVRLFLLGSYLDGMRTTIFRQAMFAEFELQIHEAVEKGSALTSETLTQMYGDLVKKYYGHNEGVCQVDDLYANEWAYIPHFYYNYYVFQYATGMVAATALSQRVLGGGEKELNDYLGFLKAGSSGYAIDILKSAGVDLTTSEPMEATMKVMNDIMDEIEAIDKAQPKPKKTK